MANNITVRDAAGASQTVQTNENTGVHLPAHQLRDSTGANVADVSAAGAVKVDGSAVTQPVSGSVSISDTATISGSVTANAGTNLNTSALALESGGNLAACATSLAIMDDWDETDRAKVNPIVGQAGVQGGSGVVGNTTQRVVLATDVGLPAGTSLLGRVAASGETGTVYQGTTACTPVFAAIAASSSGNNTIVSAAGGSNKIRVLAVQMIANGTVNAKWQSDASGTDLTGLAYLVANSGYVLPYSEAGWFETAANKLLNLNLSGATAVGGSLVYIVVT